MFWFRYWRDRAIRAEAELEATRDQADELRQMWREQNELLRDTVIPTFERMIESYKRGNGA